MVQPAIQEPGQGAVQSDGVTNPDVANQVIPGAQTPQTNDPSTTATDANGQDQLVPLKDLNNIKALLGAQTQQHATSLDALNKKLDSLTVSVQEKDEVIERLQGKDENHAQKIERIRTDREERAKLDREKTELAESMRQFAALTLSVQYSVDKETLLKENDPLKMEIAALRATTHGNQTSGGNNKKTPESTPPTRVAPSGPTGDILPQTVDSLDNWRGFFQGEGMKKILEDTQNPFK